MKQKKQFFLGTMILLSSTLFVACGNLKEGATNIDPQQVNNDTNVTTGQVVSGAYQALIEDGKYQTSTSRGLTASRLNSNYNTDNFETGLLQISQEEYSVDKYYFSEGRKIPAATIREWLSPKSEENPNGLNSEGDALVLQQIAEQNFFNIDNQALGGITIGIALNQIYYTTDGEIEIPRDQMESEGKNIANEILEQVRQLDGLDKVSITFALFEQAPKNNVAGGRYIFKATSTNGSKTIDKWETINESYISLPVVGEENNLAVEDGLNKKFTDFNSSIQGFFPESSGVTGIAYYKDNQLQHLIIDIETKYYSKTEIISFTQYAGKSIESIFDLPIEIEVNIHSIEGPQAFLSKESDKNELYSHVFY